MTITDRFLNGNDLAIKTPVKAASTANLTLSGEQTVDGVALVENDRVLVKDQTSGADNGIYVVKTGAWTRAADWDGSNDVVTGTTVFCYSGTLNNDTTFIVTTTGTITVGTTSVTIVDLSTLTVSFLAHKNGTDQTSITSATAVKVTFGSTDWNIGSAYNTSTSIFTPPPGKYIVTAKLHFTNTNAVDGEAVQVRLYKNGALHRRNINSRPGAIPEAVDLTALVDANGTDTFEVYAFKGGVGDGTVEGDSFDTWFSGVKVQ